MAHILDRNFVWVNQRWAQILGLVPGFLAGASIRSYHLDQESFEAFGQEAYAALDRGERYAADLRMRRVDGSPFWGHLTGTLLVPGQPAQGAIWTLEDVTARVEAQDELAEALTLNRKLIDSSPTGILLYRAADGTCLLMNEAAARMVAPTRESFRRLETWRGSGMLAAAEQALATGLDQRLETRLGDGDGGENWVEAQFVPFVSRGERLLLLLVMDVSERIRADRDLQESQERYRVVVDSLNEGLLIVGEDLHFTFVNERLAQMLGYEPEEVLGQFHTFILAEEDLGIMEERQRNRPVGARDNYEIRLRKKDGQTLHAILSVAPVVDAEGRPLASPVLVTDISARKRVEGEREELMGELKQKNKELETLVYVASHDLRSPLVNIQGFSQRLGKALGELKRRLESAGSVEAYRDEVLPLLQERMPAALDYIRASGAKMDAIINGLLRLSRAGRMVLRVEALDMDQLLTSCVSSMAFQLQSAEGVIQVEPLPSCKADSAQIAQVFSNLLDNAVKYRNPDRPLRVRVTGRVQGRLALYTVEDNGLGIPSEHQDRVWDIFQRLDPTGPTPGEGLGLTLVKRMVERNGGRIWVEPAQENGCQFHVELPAG
jgi:PAS domain S-box-containing protein